ncbi:MAG: hypothetical protein KAV87_39500, partial [Desulfobacteraceae bacterium]|nr:hypothetical protein [Desulfobacteraceae bacterium]
MTYSTPKMGLRAPSEFEDPFWDSDVLRMTDLDDWLLANAEDKNQIIIGSFDFDSGTSTLSWVSTIYIVNPRQSGVIQVLASSVIVADGQFAFLYVPRPYGVSTLTMQVGTPPIIDETAVPIGYRQGTEFYVKGRGVIGIPTHANAHENGGADEIDVTGLSGVLADPQDSNRLIVSVRNVSGSLIAEDKVVYVNDADSGLPTIELADPVFFDTSRIIGIIEDDIADSANGIVIIYGICTPCDTSSFTEGELLYLDSNGDMTEIRPSGDLYPVIIGRTVISDVSGEILITPNIPQYTSEVIGPIGWPNDSLANLVYSFTDGTREFLLVHVTDPTFHFYQTGTKYVKDEARIVISDIEGLHAIYYDTDDTLVDLPNPTVAEISVITRLHTSIGYVHWDATNSEHIYLGKEPHQFIMPSLTHTYLHFSFGARWQGGLSLGTFNIGNGSLDSHAQFDVASGFLADEDVFHVLLAYGSTEGVSVFYKEGASGLWRRDEVAGFSVKNFSGGNNRLAYNEWTGAVWQQTEVGNGDYALIHIFATNDAKGKGLISIQGQETYNTLGNARDGANSEIASLVVGEMPVQESFPVATVIFGTSNGYTNSVKSKVEEVSTGVNYVNWLVTEISSGTPPSSHLNLTDLLNGDAGHSQFVLGAASSVDNEVPLFDATTGKLVKNSPMRVLDDGAILNFSIGDRTPQSNISAEPGALYARIDADGFSGLFQHEGDSGTSDDEWAKLLSIRQSIGGLAWTAVAAAEANQWYSVAYGGGVFVVTSLDGTNRTMRSTDLGLTWTVVAAAEANSWRSVAYGDGVFVAVSLDGTNRTMRSTDLGLTWTVVAAAESNQWHSVAYGGGVFVAVSLDGTNRTMRSTDLGLTWSAIAAAESNSWRSVVYSNGVFVAVSTDGTNRTMRSTDLGLTWT